MSTPCVVGTWPFSREPAKIAWEACMKGQSAVDAVEAGINVAEDDPNYGPYHVGCGGWRNSAGVLQLDAAIMDGKNLDFGAVTALVGYSQPISVAKQVLTHSKHNMLTGDGAALFAAAQGFKLKHNLGKNKNASNEQPAGAADRGHDTLGLLCVDETGNSCAGVSTSGAANKEPGRVGDSALPGSGLYADSGVGAACCSGDGDEILKHCPSYRVVGYMREGLNPTAACVKVVAGIVDRKRDKANFEMVIIAVNKKGEAGAANLNVQKWKDDVNGQEYPGFPYVLASGGTVGPALHYASPAVID